MATKYMATWGPKGFLAAPDVITSLEDLTTAHSLKSEYHVDNSGPEPVNVRGMENQTIKLKVRYLSATGRDPKNQMRQWYDLLGMTYPMYIGGRQFGPPLLQLKQVDWDNFLFANNGHIIGVDAVVTLEGYVGEAMEISEKTFNAWQEKTGTEEAIDAAPSKMEKKSKK